MSYEMAILLVALLATSMTTSYGQGEKSILVRASLYAQSGSPVRFAEEMRKVNSQIARQIRRIVVDWAKKALAGSYDLAGGFWLMKHGNDAEFILSIKFPKDKLNQLGCVSLKYFTDIGEKLKAASSEGPLALKKSFEQRYNILYGVARQGRPLSQNRTMIISCKVTDSKGAEIERQEGIEEKVKQKLFEQIKGSFQDRLVCKQIQMALGSSSLQAEIDLSVYFSYKRIIYGYECMNKELIEQVLKDLVEKQEGWEYKLADIKSR